MSAIGSVLKTVGIFMLAAVAADALAQTGFTEFLAHILESGLRAFGEILWRLIAPQLPGGG